MTPVLPSSLIECTLCPQFCRMRESQRGLCRVRMNRDGKLVTLAYANPCAVHEDPVEKKPLYHFLPGSTALSVATAGCCLSCKYCQNWEISQASPEDTANVDLPPERLVQTARARGVRAVAYTYTEPTVFYEYMMDTAVLARAAGLKNIYVSCGFINPAPLKELCAVLDAANIALKAYDDGFYQSVSGARLQPVLDTIGLLHDSGVHVELNHLLVPTQNDRMDWVARMCEWIATRVGPETPLHLPRFFPFYKFRDLPPGPVELLQQARETALKSGLKYVYVGNVPENRFNNTYCPACGACVVERAGYEVVNFALDPATSRCRKCGAAIAGVWR